MKSAGMPQQAAQSQDQLDTLSQDLSALITETVSCDDSPVELLFPCFVRREQGHGAFRPQPGTQPIPTWTASGVAVVRLHSSHMDTGGVQFTATCFNPNLDPGTEFHWGQEPGDVIGDVQLGPGAYAVVKCYSEDFFRALQTDPASLGRAGGHAGLASELPVLFAGEIELSADGVLKAWSMVSGTYQIDEQYAQQAALPASLFWRFISVEEVPSFCDTGRLTMLPGGHALLQPQVDLSQVRSADDPPRKKIKTNCWEQWELSPMRQLRESGDGLSLEADIPEEDKSLRESVDEAVAEIKAGLNLRAV
jgi:hypothetical protein